MIWLERINNVRFGEETILIAVVEAFHELLFVPSKVMQQNSSCGRRELENLKKTYLLQFNEKKID